MDPMITKRLVLSYYTGHLRDPGLRKAIEDAREWDPFVRGWFTQLAEMEAGEPLAEPAESQPFSHRVEHDLALAMAAKSDGPPSPRTFPDLPSQVIDTDDRVLRMTYSAEGLPYGVARVTVTKKADGVETIRRLIVFPKFGDGKTAIRQAEIRLDDLGVSMDDPPKVDVFVVFAVEENLRDFPPAEVSKLAEECNGNYGSYIAVQSLLERLGRGGKS